jgi:hypothetical protein
MDKKYFKNFGPIDDFVPTDNTLHLAARQNRLAAYADGPAEKLADILVDRQHPNGLEIHRLFSNAQVNIYNQDSGKFITTLRLRPGQIDRYIVDTLTSKQIDQLKRAALNNFNQQLNEK